jgi:hypothetical protein
MWHSVGLVRTDVSEEPAASMFRVGRTNRMSVIATAVSSLQVLSTLKLEAIRSS